MTEGHQVIWGWPAFWRKKLLMTSTRSRCWVILQIEVTVWERSKIPALSCHRSARQSNANHTSVEVPLCTHVTVPMMNEHSIVFTDYIWWMFRSSWVSVTFHMQCLSFHEILLAVGTNTIKYLVVICVVIFEPGYSETGLFITGNRCLN